MSKPLAVIIEDDPFQLDIFTKALEAADYDVVGIEEGNEAVRQLGEIVPHLILLDLHLPNVDGTQILAHIQADERLSQTRVLIASADGALAAYLRKQVDLVLEKPVSYSQLRLLAARLRPNG